MIMAKAKQNTLRITQIRSQIGYKKKARLTLEALGLRRMHQTVELNDTPAIRGMIKVVEFLVKVEEVA